MVDYSSRFSFQLRAVGHIFRPNVGVGHLACPTLDLRSEFWSSTLDGDAKTPLTRPTDDLTQATGSGLLTITVESRGLPATTDEGNNTVDGMAMMELIFSRPSAMVSAALARKFVFLNTASFCINTRVPSPSLYHFRPAVPKQPYFAPLVSQRSFSRNGSRFCTNAGEPKRNTLVNFSLSDSEDDSDSSEEEKNKKAPAKAADKSKPPPPPYDPFSKKAVIEEPDDPKNLQDVFHKMRADGMINNAVKMFDGLSKDGLTHEALELFSVIKDKSEMPDVVAHTAVIEAYCDAGQPKEAHKVYQRMLVSGVLPNAYTYSVLIQVPGEER
nr:pentatricopeptide repeat-containing protein At4g38150-like [Ipomoea batatas]